jgi:hypothetical protein
MSLKMREMHVVRARAAVGRGRAFVEDEERRVAAQLEALLEDALVRQNSRMRASRPESRLT